MADEISKWTAELDQVLADFEAQASLKKGQLFVVGCSTSEVIGEKIGSSGTLEVAAFIYGGLQRLAAQTGVQLAFQCCEHLNRALVVERETVEAKGLEEVSVVPVRSAGGAMATYAYHHMKEPVVVESVRADAGIDIGDTLIGMHIKSVAVPVRASLKTIGSAHVTLARSRPKLIGGARAVYEHLKENEQC